MDLQLDHSDEHAIVKQPRKIDWSLVLIVFFIGISVGALIPVGMKFFGVWNKPSTGSATSLEKDDDLSMPKTKAKQATAPRLKNIPLNASSSREAAEPSSLAMKAKNNPKQELKTKELKASNKEAISIPSPAPLPASVSAVSTKGKKAEKSAPILEEMASGPSAIEIQNLTMAVEASKGKTEPSVGSVSTPARGLLTSTKAPETAPKPGQLVALSAKTSPSPTVSLKSGLLTTMNVPEAKSDSAAAPKVVAMVVNNASYNKNSLSTCQKRCLLMGLDAFGMPIKAIIDGAVYAEALKQHSGTINLAGQPRFVKNQQVLIVESITFNIAPKTATTDPNHNPALKNTLPSDPSDPRPGTVVQESH